MKTKKKRDETRYLLFPNEYFILFFELIRAFNTLDKKSNIFTTIFRPLYNLPQKSMPQGYIKIKQKKNKAFSGLIKSLRCQ